MMTNEQAALIAAAITEHGYGTSIIVRTAIRYAEALNAGLLTPKEEEEDET